MSNTYRPDAARTGAAIVIAHIALIGIVSFTVILSARGAESTLVWLCALLSLFTGMWLVAVIIAMGGPGHVLRSVLLLGIIASVPTTNWPVHMTFRLSRTEFARLADALESGEELSFPRHVGIFRVEAGERRTDRTCLWLDPHPGGPRGFVKAPPGEPPWFNIWSSIALDDNWHLVAED